MVFVRLVNLLSVLILPKYNVQGPCDNIRKCNAS